MSPQLHKRFTLEEIKSILKRYADKEIKSKDCQMLLNLGRSQFFELWKRYQADPKNFKLIQERKKASRSLDQKTDKKIRQELLKEKKIIENHRNPVRFYNYSYLKQVLEEKHDINVSVPTIIDRAKKVDATWNASRLKTATTEKSSPTMWVSSFNMTLPFINGLPYPEPIGI